jgi:predicted DNA-binding transcriptional regulator AlpA
LPIASINNNHTQKYKYKSGIFWQNWIDIEIILHHKRSIVQRRKQRLLTARGRNVKQWRLNMQTESGNNRGPVGFMRLASIIAPDGPIPVGKSTWWEGCRTGRFPKPVKLTPRVTVWRVTDIEDLIAKLNSVESEKNSAKH